MDRHDLAEGSARHAAADTFEKIESSRLHLGLRLAPIQLRIFSGLVRKAKTVPGGAAIWVSRRTTSGSVIGASLIAVAQMAAPEPVLARVARDHNGAASTP